MKSQEIIAIVEDEEFQRSFLAKQVRKVAQEQGASASVEAFAHKDGLVRRLQEGVRLKLLLTDYSDVGWGGINGIMDFMAEERQDCPVIVSTGMPLEIISNQEGFTELEKQGYHFLLKPRNNNRFKELLEGLLSVQRSTHESGQNQ